MKINRNIGLNQKDNFITFEKNVMSTETESIEAKRLREEKTWHDAKLQREEKEQRDVYYNDVRIIRKNVQYFFWISIISIVSTAIVLFVDF